MEQPHEHNTQERGRDVSQNSLGALPTEIGGLGLLESLCERGEGAGRQRHKRDGWQGGGRKQADRDADRDWETWRDEDDGREEKAKHK